MIKGRLINIEKSSQKKIEEVDRLIDTEVEKAYQTAIDMLRADSKSHNLLIDAMMEYKTINYDEIDLLLSSQNPSKLKKARRSREEKKGKQSGVSGFIGNLLSGDKTMERMGQNNLRFITHKNRQ